MQNDLELKLVLRASDQGVVGVVREVRGETDQLNDALDKTRKATGAAAGEQDRLQGALGDTAGQASRSGRAVDGLNDELDSHSGKTKKAAKESDGFSKSLGSGAVKAGLWAAAIAAAAAAAGGIASSLRTEAIRETHVMSQTLDMSAEALSSWEYAAQQVNLGSEKMGDIFKDTSDKLGDFVATGGGEAADLFESLNLKMSELVGLSPDQQLLKIGGALEEVGDRGQQIFFLESLADDASRLLPLLENDAAELKRLQLEAQVLGVSLTDIDAAKVAQAAQAMDRVQGIGRGIANDLTIELAPVLTGVSNLMVESAVGAGGFRDVMRTAVDVGVAGVGILLDKVHNFQKLLKMVEYGWLMIGQAGTSAMASVADSTAQVINDVMGPFQQSIAWVLEKFSYLIELGASMGGPFEEQFAAAAETLKGFKGNVEEFSVSAEEIIALNQRVSEAAALAAEELAELLNADAPSDKLKERLQQWREEAEEAAEANEKLGTSFKQTGAIAGQQSNTYAKLVDQLEFERDQLQRTELERQIQINLRRLDADAAGDQEARVRQLTTEIYNEQQALQQAQEQLKLAQSETNVWAEITENAVNSVDDSFRDLFRSGLDGWDDFWDQMQDTAKDMLAELAYTLAKQKLWVNVGMNVTGQSGSAGAVTAMAGQGGSLMSNAGSLIQNGSSILRNGLDFFNPSSGYTTMAVNQTAASMGYGFAADGMGPPVALVDSGGYVAQGLNAVGPGLAAYGMAQKYGPLGGVAGGVGSAALAGGISGALGGTGFMSGAATALGAINPIGWAAIGIGALLGGLEKEPSNKEGRTIVDLANGESTIGGQSGDKRDDENRDASAQIAAVFSDTVIPLLNQYGTNTIGGSYVVGVGDRDPLRFHYDSVADGDSDWEYGTGRNNSQGHSYDTRIAGNTRDPEKFIGSVTEFLAEQAGINTAFFNALADEGEQFYETLHRIETQFAVLSEVDLFADLEGVAGEAGKRAADTLAESIYTELGTAQESQLETLLRVSNAWTVVTSTAEQLNQSLDVTGMAALEAATNIVELAGGVEALANGSSYYYQNYFSEQERAQDQVDAYTAMLSQFNAEFDTTLGGRDDLRAFVESLDLSTTAGQEAYVAAMQLAPVLIGLSESMQVLTADQRALQAEIDKTVDGWMSAEEQLAAQRNQIDAFNGTLGRTGNAAIDTRDEMAAYLRSLDLTTESGRSAAESALELVNAVEAVADANKTATESEQALANERLNNARSQLLATLESGIAEATGRQAELENAAANAKEQLISALSREISTIEQLEAGLRQRVDDARQNLVGALERGIAAAQAQHDSLAQSLDSARNAYIDAIGAQISALNSQINAQQNARAEAQSTAQAWRNAADSLADARADLLADTWSPEQSRAGSKNSFDEALAGAWGGSIEAFKALPQLAQDAQVAARSTSATGTDYRLATARLAAQLSDAESLGASKASAQDRLVEAADRQLASLNNQVERLRAQQETLQSIDATALNVAEAAAQYHQAQAAYQSDDSQAKADAYAEQLAAMQTVDTDLLTIAEAQQALAAAERELAGVHHSEQLDALNEELEELEGVNANLVALDAARARYESAALDLARSTYNSEIGVMRAQLTALQQVNSSVMSLPRAIASYLDAGGEALPGFSEGGIATGPTSGYRVELHGTEAVIPLRGGAVPVALSDGGMSAEVRQLRQEIARLSDDIRRIGGQQIKAGQKVAKVLAKWDVDGNPPTRSAS